MRAHRVGGGGGVSCSFCTTSHHLSPPPHRPAPRHAHLPLSPLSHGDFRPVAKCKFLDDRDTRNRYTAVSLGLRCSLCPHLRYTVGPVSWSRCGGCGTD